MQLLRMFSKEKYKGSRNYLDSQKKYEVLRTILYFFISGSLFAAGWITTGSRENLLTIVAVLGCLPACKSTVDMVMFLRYRSCGEPAAGEIAGHIGELEGLYDLVFTSQEKNYQIAHITVKGNTLCGYTEDGKFDAQAFARHLDGILKMDGFTQVSLKIFTDLHQYTARLEQLKELEADEKNTQGILGTLKSVTL